MNRRNARRQNNGGWQRASSSNKVAAKATTMAGGEDPTQLTAVESFLRKGAANRLSDTSSACSLGELQTWILKFERNLEQCPSPGAAESLRAHIAVCAGSHRPLISVSYPKYWELGIETHLSLFSVISQSACSTFHNIRRLSLPSLAGEGTSHCAICWLRLKGSLVLSTPGDPLSSIAPPRDAPSSPLGGTVAYRVKRDPTPVGSDPKDARHSVKQSSKHCPLHHQRLSLLPPVQRETVAGGPSRSSRSLPLVSNIVNDAYVYRGDRHRKAPDQWPAGPVSCVPTACTDCTSDVPPKFGQ